LAFAGDFVRLPSTGIVTLAETLERSPDRVRRMVRAVVRARTFAKNSKEKVLSILSRALKIDDYHKRVETPDGRIDAALVAEAIRETRQTEKISAEIAPNQVFDFSYLPAR